MFKSFEGPKDNFMPTESVTDSGESLTSQLPTVDTKSSNIVTLPSNKLEPPLITNNVLNKNSTQDLPYFQESLLPPANTIERTVTIRITLPEKVASYLFKNSNKTDFDKLEILNTGNSDYLVLSNDFRTNPNFVTTGKLNAHQNRNISNSQALVFSLLADSINAAKEYTNIAQQEVVPATPGTTQFQNVNEAELSQITNMISKLTSTQYADIYNRNENIITTPQNIPTNIQSNQLIAGNVQNNNPSISPRIPQRILNLPSQQRVQYLSSQFQSGAPNTNFLANNGNQVYSGQLYQFSVPEVTNQIYNRPFTSYIGQPANNPGQGNTANFIHSNIPQNAPSNFIPTANTQPQYSQDTNLFPSGDRNHDVTNLLNQSPTAVEIVQSQTLPYSSAKLQIGSSDQSTQTFNQETLANLLSGDNGISAHLQDKIIGTIKHPLESDKLVTYEKDQSYYFTSNLNKNTPGPNFSGNLIQPTSNVEAKPSNANFPNTLTLQFIPSNGYEVENERQQQKLLDTFQIDEFGAPREVVSNIDRSNNQEQILTSNIDYSVEHPTSARQLDGTNNINALYSGPSSYSAPQSSVVGGRSDRQNQYNSNLEDLDENNENGYPRTRPARQFTF